MSGEPDAAQSGEDRLIAQYFRPLAWHAGAFALMDDAAAIAPPPGCDLVLKTDGIIGGVHFFSDDPPALIGKKALRVNLSDLAAKAARPLGFLLTLALPDQIGDAWLASFSRGLGEDAEFFECPLFGGDTDRTPGPITISIAVFGAVPHGRMLRRAGAQADDCIVVTGTIGDASLGLALRGDASLAGKWSLNEEQRNQLQSRYLVPQPRVGVGEIFGRHASAAMDISDGLAGDLAKLCRASGVGAEVHAARVPLSQAAGAALGRAPTVIETVLTGGDDYEILAAVPAGKVETLRKEAAARGVAVTEIGTMRAGDSVRVLDQDGNPLAFARPSFSHF
ncbi:MAG TPA: thiamine-phosphate kinase [Xanthobacteraceae bacterium]|jgi:thiamine-monophosphate kinase